MSGTLALLIVNLGLISKRHELHPAIYDRLGLLMVIAAAINLVAVVATAAADGAIQ